MANISFCLIKTCALI